MTLQRIVIASAVAAALALLFLLPRFFERQEPPTVAPIELREPKAPAANPRRKRPPRSPTSGADARD